MSPDHLHYAEWDAAYVLGALSAADRREYEDHLESCAECRKMVAELTPMVGLLSRISPEDAGSVTEAGPSASARTGLVDLARVRRRRDRTRWFAAAAAVLVVAVIAAPIALSFRPAGAAMANATNVPLEASVLLTSVDWGTRVELECAYPEVDVADVPEGGWTYALAVVGEDGAVSTVSTWRAAPGTSARVSAGTALAVDDISSIEIRSAKGDILMTYTVPD